MVSVSRWLLGSLLLSQILSQGAWAHVPHEALLAAAVPTSATPDQPWISVLFDEDAVGLYRSVDKGTSWQAVWGEPMQDAITGGAYTWDGWAILVGEGRYWYSEDGVGWSAVALPFSPSTEWSPVAGGDKVYFAALDGIWTAAPGEEPTQVLSGVRMLSIHGGAGGPVALDVDGGVYHVDSNRWPRIDPPPGETLYSATATTSDVYVGTLSGAIYRWDGKAWNTCAEAPFVVDAGTHPEVSRLASEGNRVMGVRAKVGAFWTEDRCETWVASLAPMTNYFEEDASESFTTPARAFTYLGWSGDRLYLGGYDGAAVLAEGRTWYHSRLIGADYTRGIAYSNDFNSDGRLLLAAYGGGTARSLDGGYTFAAPGLGVRDANVQEVYVPDNVDGMDLAYATFNRVLYRTTDQGSTWEVMPGPFTALRQYTVGPGDRMWGADVASDTPPPNDVLFSEDAGASWQEITNLPGSFGDDTVFQVYDADPWVCLRTMTNVACSSDDRGTFVDAFSTDASGDRIMDVTGWPLGVPEHLLVGVASGIWKIDGVGGSTQVWEAGTAGIRRMAVADDGTVFAGDEAGRLLRSDDGGDTWYDTGVEVPCQIKTINPRPDFATWGELLIGGMDGTFLIDEAGLHRFGAYEREDNVTEYIFCRGCREEDDATAAIGKYEVVSFGQLFSGDIRGHTIRVHGRSDGTQMAELIVDGVVMWADVVPATDGFGVLVEVSGLSDTWHFVDFTVMSEGTIDVDALEAFGDGQAFAGFVEGGVDADGDGYLSSLDCDDANPTAHPDAAELCDEANVDEDCDGLSDDADDSVDDAGKVTVYPDADGDGDGAGTGERFCDVPEGYAATGTDCDDADPADESCDEAKDPTGCGCASIEGGAGSAGMLALVALVVGRRRR